MHLPWPSMPVRVTAPGSQLAGWGTPSGGAGRGECARKYLASARELFLPHGPLAGLYQRWKQAWFILT